MRALLLLLLLASPCYAGVHKPFIGDCYAYADVVATLAAFGETSNGPSLVKQSGTALEAFISTRGTITIVEVLPTGLTCYRAFNNGSAERGAGWGAPPRNMSPM